MHFTSNLKRVVGGTLTVPVLGLMGWVNPVTAAPAPVQTRQTSDVVAILPAVDRASATGLQTAKPDYYQPVAHYKSKHWLKRNAPIVGGAAGGALIGGLAGGGAGALIGGGLGAGGGALFKHFHHHHHYYH